MDGARRMCLAASQRMAWTREDRAESKRKVDKRHSGAGRPWSIARLILRSCAAGRRYPLHAAS